MKDEREQVVERLYDVMLDEVAGEQKPSDLTQRVKSALESDSAPQNDLEPIIGSRRWWFAPFATAATAAILVVVVSIVYQQQVSQDTGNTTAKLNTGSNEASRSDRNTPSADMPKDYAIVRSVQDLAALGTDVQAIMCDGVSAQEITQLAQRDFPTLEYLTFVRSDFSNVAMATLALPGNVQVLNLEECRGLEDEDLLLAVDMQGLRRLVLIRCEGLTLNGVTQLQLKRPELEINVEYVNSSSPSSAPPLESNEPE